MSIHRSNRFEGIDRLGPRVVPPGQDNVADLFSVVLLQLKCPHENRHVTHREQPNPVWGGRDRRRRVDPARRFKTDGAGIAALSQGSSPQRAGTLRIYVVYNLGAGGCQAEPSRV
jgi:hypothetical protein